MQQKLLFEQLLDMVLQQENVFSDYTVQQPLHDHFK